MSEANCSALVESRVDGAAAQGRVRTRVELQTNAWDHDSRSQDWNSREELILKRDGLCEQAAWVGERRDQEELCVAEGLFGEVGQGAEGVEWEEWVE